MKRILLIVILILLASGFARAEGVYFKISGSYFYPSDSWFQDIYGGGIKLGGELAFKVWDRLDLWIDGGFLSRKGELTFTKEETKLRIIPVGGGLRYRLTSGTFNLYMGAGVTYFMFHEENVIGTVDSGGVGFTGKVGALIKVTRGLIFDIFVNYLNGKMTPADFTINVGGIEAGLGIGFEF
ncbi:outer membrane beta-barrel protein [Acidobacteriota bacterium]